MEQAARNLGAYRLVRSQALALKAWHAGNRNWLDHLALLCALLPGSHDLYVTALSTSARNTLTLGVRARSSEIVDRASSALRAAGYQLRPPAIIPISDRYGYGFQANLELSVPATVTNDLDHLVVESRTPPQPPQAVAAPTPATPAPVAPKPPAAPDQASPPPARPPDSASGSGRRRHWRRAERGGPGG